MKDMGDRMAWARIQQGMTLQQVAEATGLTTAYISQLEKRARSNPTIETLASLAKALGVSMSFLLGEVPYFSVDDRAHLLLRGQAGAIGKRFIDLFEQFSPEEKEAIRLESVEGRVSHVIAFLCDHFPHVFTPVVIAFQLGVSLRALQELTDQRCESARTVLRQLSAMTGLPYSFFAVGIMDPSLALPESPPASSNLASTEQGLTATPQAAAHITLRQALMYAEPVYQALAHRITPPQLTQIIRSQAQTSGHPQAC